MTLQNSVFENNKDNKVLNDSKNIFSIHIIRAIATVLVVLLHSSSPYIKLYGEISTMDWMISNAFESISRISVPLFFVVSGYLLLRKTDEPLEIFFKKRFMRVVIPYVFWGLLYILYWDVYIASKPFNFLDILNKFIQGKVFFHFWFIYAIIGLYLFTPILRTYIKTATRSSILYYLVLWGIAMSLLPLIKLIGINSNLNDNILLYFNGYIGYFLLGYYLEPIHLKKAHRKFAFILFLLGFLITFWGTFFATRSQGEFVRDFYLYASPNVFLTTITFYLLVKDIEFENITFFGKDLLTKVILLVSKNSYVIYLFHVFVLFILRRRHLWNIEVSTNNMHAFLGVTLSVLISVLVSMILSVFMKKIRFLQIFT